ncbi:MAG: restriction endonuclease FokI C-terminal domain-containing protein [Flavobacteriales bacterium]
MCFLIKKEGTHRLGRLTQSESTNVSSNFTDNMNQTTENAIAEYKKLKAHLGKQPTSAEFYNETAFSEGDLIKLFGSKAYSKLVKECGDVPNVFAKPKSDLEQTLIQWGNLAREMKALPAASDWLYKKLKPTSSRLQDAHGFKWSDIQYKFLELFSDKEEWKDIIALIPPRLANDQSISKSIPKVDGLNFETLKFIPPIVQDLIDSSLNEEKSREFEKSVNLVFQMLGFEVTDYGQGTGRNPDGIAKENQNRYAILIDAKSRRDNYKIGTEDRKFIEYIKTFSEPLRKSGFTNIYFLVVSSGFDTVSLTAIKNIKVETQVTTTLLTSRLLLKLLSNKIQTPRLFDLKKFQELLIEDGEITEKRIDKFIAGQK